MSHTNKSTATQEFKVNALLPILEDWNNVIHEDWQIEKDPYSEGSVNIYSFTNRQNIHGLLLSDIARICNAYNWTWALYTRGIDLERTGIEIRIN